MTILYERMDIPKACIVGNTVFKKLFYENASMNANDKQIFKDHISKITWKYSLKPETINISEYKDADRDYDEIAVIEVELVDTTKAKRIAEIVQRTIPYPLILVLVKDEQFQLSLTHKKTNKGDESKNTIEEHIFTDWIHETNIQERDNILLNGLHIKNLSFSNFYAFYTDILNRIYLYIASKHNNQAQYTALNAEQVKKILDEINELNQEIDDLKRAVKKEKHFNRKVELNIKLNDLKCRNRALIEKLDLK